MTTNVKPRQQQTTNIYVKDVDQAAFVKALSAFFKKSGKLKVPDWVDCVKTGVYKELAPYDDDWFYTRTASVARHLYIRFPAGVKTMAKIYGGRKRNGVRPAHFARGSASVARKCLQALEGLKLAEKDGSGGRRLTAQGRKDLDRIATQIRGTTSKPGATSAFITSTAAPAVTTIIASESVDATAAVV